jgi:hypothetical protein
MMKKQWTKNPLTTQLNPAWCPSCFTVLDAATCMTADDAKPQPGDYTVCIGCAQVLRFTPQMDLEMSSLEAIPTHSRMAFARVVQEITKRTKPVEPWKC